MRLVLDNGDEDALNRRAAQLEQRIRGISIRIDYPPRCRCSSGSRYDQWG
ncbi:hypothetical protein ACIP3A_30480 [Streptomyces tricolor]|nr:hypothetical protein [Streptomyces sp. PBH53]